MKTQSERSLQTAGFGPVEWVPHDPQDTARLASLAAALKTEGRVEEARQAFEKVIEQSPERPDYYCGLAMVQRELNRSREAADTLRRALDLDPSHTQARQLLAEVYLDMGIYTGVIEEAKVLLEGSPGNAPALAVLAIACQQTGAIAEAIDSIEQLVRLCPMEPHNHFVLGTLYRQRGEISRALARFERVIDLAHGTDMAKMAQGEIQNMDGTQIQMVLLLAAEDPHFRIALEEDPIAAADDYGFSVSDQALSVLSSLDFNQIPERPAHWGPPTHH